MKVSSWLVAGGATWLWPQVEKLAGCWWRTMAEEDYGISDHGNFVGDAYGTLGINFSPFSTVEFLLAELGSSLSKTTAVCHCEGVDMRVGLS